MALLWYLHPARPKRDGGIFTNLSFALIAVTMLKPGRPRQVPHRIDVHWCEVVLSHASLGDTARLLQAAVWTAGTLFISILLVSCGQPAQEPVTLLCSRGLNAGPRIELANDVGPGRPRLKEPMRVTL